MGARVPVEEYNLGLEDSYIGSSLGDLKTVDARLGKMDGVIKGSLDNDDESNSVDCLHDSYTNPLGLHGDGVEEDRSVLDNDGSPQAHIDILTIEDISPIETARARFLEIILDNFLNKQVIEVPDSEPNSNGVGGQDKLNKRKPKEIQYEGDPRYPLPLMYVANMYETLVNDVNMRLTSLEGNREKTIGVALEASGGLYRRIAKKFPRKGPCSFKRRELATSLETKTRYPEIVTQEEKRIRFIVVNGLEIVEKPNSVPFDDAEWFKRLTGRSEVAISATDYKFYSPRHKIRRTTSSSVSSIGLPPFAGSDNSPIMDSSPAYHPISEIQNSHQSSTKLQIQSISHQPQFHLHQTQHQSAHENQHTSQFSHSHQCSPPSQLPDISQAHQIPTVTQQLICLQTPTVGHVGSRLHIQAIGPATPAKFCDHCGTLYLRETSKFCSECGTKRLGVP